MARDHGVAAAIDIGLDDAERVARAMSALGTASRVRILAHLRQGPCSVGELTARVEMAQPAVSHQLRILRDLGLVVGARQGRNTVYGLYDDHVRSLLDEALRHVEHQRAGHAEAITPKQPKTTTKVRTIMTDQHSHDTPHAHEHDHGDVSHEHPHTTHEHPHVEHEHEHSHGEETHAHAHVHQDGQEEGHEHNHA